MIFFLNLENLLKAEDKITKLVSLAISRHYHFLFSSFGTTCNLLATSISAKNAHLN